MANFEIKDGVAIIPDGVTKIDRKAFKGCTSLTSIEIPNSVISIGGWAFEGCTGLTSITVETGNTKYDSRDNCNAIIETATNTLIVGCQNTTIPNSVTNIGDRAFFGCTGLTSVQIPNSITSIDSSAFEGCTGLTSVLIGNSVTSIGHSAFKGCTSLTSITIPKSVTEIEKSAFEGCTTLQNVVISEGVTNIGYKAFRGCTSLRSIEIPASTTKIGSGFFYDCPALESIKVAEGNPVYDSRNNCNAIICTKSNELIGGCKSTVIPSSVTTIGMVAFAGCVGLTDIVIPNSVKTIKGSAFRNCTGLTKIVIPASVEDIETHSHNNIDVFFQPFIGCSNLTSIVVDKENLKYTSGDNCNAIMSKEASTLYVGCATTVIPTSVELINECAFAGATMTEITIPDSVEKIKEGAFYNCVNLKSVVFGKGLKSIMGKNTFLSIPAAFCNCKSLEAVVLPASLDWVGTTPFVGCDKLCSIVVEEGNTKYDSRNNCNAVIDTRYNILMFGCKTTVIPESVVEIETGAFEGCNGLTDVTVPANVVKFGLQIFRNCKGLKSATILGAVKDIDDPFFGCSSLETVTFGAGIKKMHEYIFDNTPALMRINVPAKKAEYYKKRLPEKVHRLIVELEPEKKTKK